MMPAKPATARGCAGGHDVVAEVGLEQQRRAARRPHRPVDLEQLALAALVDVLRRVRSLTSASVRGCSNAARAPSSSGKVWPISRARRSTGRCARRPDLDPDHLAASAEPVPDEGIQRLPGLGGIRGHRVGERGLHHADREVVGELGDRVHRLLLGDALADQQPADRDDGGDDKRGERHRQDGPPRRRGPSGAARRGRAGEHDPAGRVPGLRARRGRARPGPPRSRPPGPARCRPRATPGRRGAAVVVARLGPRSLAAPVVAGLGVRGDPAPVIAGLGVRGDPAAVIAGLGVRGSGRAPVIARLGVPGDYAAVVAWRGGRGGRRRGAVTGVVVGEHRRLRRARHRHRDLVAERRVASQPGDGGGGSHAAGDGDVRRGSGLDASFLGSLGVGGNTPFIARTRFSPPYDQWTTTSPALPLLP